MNKKSIDVSKINSITILNEKFKNNFLITNKNIKDEILNNAAKSGQILNFKIQDESQASEMFGNYIDDTVLFYLYQKYNNYELAKNIFTNLAYLNKETCIVTDNDSYNLKIVKEEYNFFREKELINLNDKHNYLDVDKIKSLNLNLEYLNIPYQNYNLFSDFENPYVNVDEFTNVNEEIEYKLNQIAALIDKGIDITKIRLYAPNSYKDNIKVLAYMYNIIIDNNDSHKISEQKIVKESIDEIINKGIKPFIKRSKTESFQLSLTDEDKNFLNEIIKIINKYINVIDEEKIDQFIVEEIKNIKTNNRDLDSNLEIKNINDFIFDEELYNFVLGFDSINLLNYAKDNDFLLDVEKEKINVETSSSKNIKLKENIKTIIKYNNNVPNTSFSFSKKFNQKELECYDSGIKTIKTKVSFDDFLLRFSKTVDHYEYKNRLVEILAFGSSADKNKLSIFRNLLANKNEFNFALYNSNRLDKINFDLNKFKEEQMVSATMLDLYYRSPYTFYLEKILKLKKKIENDEKIQIGNYIHYLLEKIVNEDYQIYNSAADKEEFTINIDLLKEDLHKYTEEYKEQLNLKKKEFFGTRSKTYQVLLVQKVVELMEGIIPVILEVINSEEFTIKGVEEELEYDFNGYRFGGKVDLILERFNRYMVLDYKTGNKVDLLLSDEEVLNGINLQNLIYFKLMQNNKDKYSAVNFGGTYRVKVKAKPYNLHELNSKDELYQETVKRTGYTSYTPEVLNGINTDNYKNLKFKKDGTPNKDSRVFTDEEFDEKMEIIDEKIKEFIKNLEEDKVFGVEPLMPKEMAPTMYNQYKDICYITE